MNRLFLLVISVFICYGCSSVDRVIQDEISQTDLIIAKELESMSSLNSKSSLKSISYSDFLTLALKNDPQIKAYSFAKERNVIRKKQIDTEKWPRFSLSTSLEFPLNGDDWKAQDGVSGGLVIEYDILKSLFNSDFASAEEIERLKVLTKTKEAYNSTYRNVLGLIADIDNQQEKLTYYSDILELLNEMIINVEKVDKLMGRSSKSLWSIKIKQNLFKNFKNKTEKQLDSTYCKLSIMVNSKCGNRFEITDYINLLDAIDNYAGRQHNLEKIIPMAIKSRSDMNFSRYEMYLSKLNIRKAERGWMPRVSMSLGFGDYETSYNDTETNVLAKVNISYPIFDFGDTDRKIELAELNHDSREEKLKLTTTKAIVTIQNSYNTLSELYGGSLEFSEWISQIRSRSLTLKKLEQMNKANKREVLNAEISLLEAKIELSDINRNIRKQVLSCLSESDQLIQFISK